MKKIVLAALGAFLIAGVAVDTASAAQRNQARGNVVQAPARAYDDSFRDSYNAYGRGFDRPAYDARVQGGAISAPAGR